MALNKVATQCHYFVGLTGGIASGKSTVAKLFTAKGIELIDTDLIARLVVEPGSPGLISIAKHFGPGVINAAGELDRDAMRQQIFDDEAARQSLQALIHPLIWQEVARRKLACVGIYAIIDVPLLVESRRFDQYDQILVVDVLPKIQRARLKSRDQRTDDEIDKILASQASRKERLAVADEVIDNNGSLDQLSQQIEILHQRFTALGRAKFKQRTCGESITD